MLAMVMADGSIALTYGTYDVISIVLRQKGWSNLRFLHRARAEDPPALPLHLATRPSVTSEYIAAEQTVHVVPDGEPGSSSNTNSRH